MSRAKHARVSPAVLKRRRIAALSAAAVVIAGAVVAAVSLTGGSTANKKHHHSAPAVASDRCPLTDQRAPGGQVPDRPAVAVSIGNEPEGARPQSGLDEADIVYDTPAEGGVMRYVAVFQCKTASSIGPDRSVRWVEWHLVQGFGHPILAFAGGINPDVDTVQHLGFLRPVDLLTAPASAWTRITSRVPPDNLYTSITGLLGQYPKDKTPPPAVFHYGGALPSSATAAASLAINVSSGTDILWKWDKSTHSWLHTYSGQTDTDALTNKPVTATNIVVQIVSYKYGPFAESPGATGDVESKMTGTGHGYVLRDGKSIPVTWHRPSWSSGTTFTDSAGKPVTLAPGRTWVEVVLDSTASTPGALAITP